MKKIHFSIFLLSIFLTFSPAFAAGENVIINSIDAEFNIGKDGIVRITERISADFSLSPGHGIYRDIPYVYKKEDGTALYTEITSISVTDSGGVPQKFSVTKNEANLRIKIGDPDVLIYGAEEYVIYYSVKGILMSFASYDEFYWNVVGTGWTSTIGTSSAVVILPEAGIIQISCYEGTSRSPEECSSKSMDGNRAYFSDSDIRQNEAFTVAIGFTKGMTALPVVEGPVVSGGGINISKSQFVIFFVTLGAGFFGIWYMWWKKGRDFWWKRKALFDPDAKEELMPIGAHETIVPEYESPIGLRPAEIGVLMDEKADTLDISATIVDLAIRGYLKIEEIPKKWRFGSVDYKLIFLDKSTEGLMEYEKLLLDSLSSAGKFKGLKISDYFKTGPVQEPVPEDNSVILSDLKEKFYTKLKKVKESLYSDSVDKKLFVSNPNSVRNRYLISSSVGTAIICVLLFAVADGYDNLLAFLVALLFIFLIFLSVASQAMPQRTAYGRELYRKARGYELFVSSTEKYRQPFFENENTFMAILPYAMVFGVTDKLAKAMEQMGIQPQQPVWFVGTTPFNIGDFGHSMDSLSNSLSSAMASAPGGSGSGGGGGAGGGGGGGGGGGW